MHCGKQIPSERNMRLKKLCKGVIRKLQKRYPRYGFEFWGVAGIDGPKLRIHIVLPKKAEARDHGVARFEIQEDIGGIVEDLLGVGSVCSFENMR